MNGTSIITNINISELITDILLYLFPEADSHCRDVSRIFFGGKKLLICNETPFNYLNLLMEFSGFLKEKYGETYYKEHLKNFAQRHASKEFLEDYEIIIDEDILASSAKNTVDVLIEDLKKIPEYYKVRNFLKSMENKSYMHTEPENTYIYLTSQCSLYYFW